ncbi:MAG: M20/M25/M40 family metallo-hydrolase [Armatimonadota bacterium]|nr:M20/M25/M40 family metallo-hydrolase [Armatimonadota bacterium]MDR7532663.1 M20/M25/M40 family metallo-hydrolase [Armatimonadota bacterium]MDR7536314.1 M20/M25/M40 family metallo-hydrolase [Armatimonadota bacterium]
MSHPIAAALRPERVIDLARSMIRIPSFTGQEQAVAHWLAETMEAMGFDEVKEQLVAPDRPNVLGLVRGTDPSAPSVLFNGHTDHNMVCDGWTRDPFGADVDGEFLYGLGAANMKAGNAAMLAAVEAALRAGLRPRGDLKIAFVVGELQGGLGTQAALRAGLRADMFLLAEPTELGVLTMHAGVVQARVVVHGEMRHYTTRAGRKIHAIEKAMAIARALGPSYEPIPPDGWLTFTPHPDYDGLPRYNLGVIRGGITPEILAWRPALVPDYCEMILDIRVTPGQTPETVLADLRRLIERLRRDDPDLRADVGLVEGRDFFPPFHVPLDHPVVGAMMDAHRAVFGDAPRVGALAPTKYAGADSAHMAAAGIPGVLYGPGGKYLSIPDERVEVEHVVGASRAFCLVIERVWGLS